MGRGDGQLDSPRGLALTASGTILVCEESNHRVSELRVSDGAFVCKWGKNGGSGVRGSNEGEFNDPTTVIIGDDGKVFVSDTENHRIQVFI